MLPYGKGICDFFMASPVYGFFLNSGDLNKVSAGGAVACSQL